MDSRVVSELEYAELVLDGVLSGRVIKIYEESDTIAGMMGMCGDRVEWVSGDSIGADTVAGMQFIGRAFKAVWRLIVRAVMAVVSGLKKLWEWLTGGKGSTNPDTPGATYQDTPTPVGGVIGKEMAKEDKATVETALAVAELEEKGVDIEKAVSEVTPEMLEAARLENNTRDDARLSKIKKDVEEAEEFNKRERERLDAAAARFNATVEQEAANKKEAARIAAADKEAAAQAAARDEARIKELRKQRSGFTRIKITNDIRKAYVEDVDMIEDHAIIISGGMDRSKMSDVIDNINTAIKKIEPVSIDEILELFETMNTSLPGLHDEDSHAMRDRRRLVRALLNNAEWVYEIFNMPHGYLQAMLGLYDGITDLDPDDASGSLISPDTGGGRVFEITISTDDLGMPSFTLSVTKPSQPTVLEYIDIVDFNTATKAMYEMHMRAADTAKLFRPAQRAKLQDIKDGLKTFDGITGKYRDEPHSKYINSIVASMGNEYKNMSKALKFVSIILKEYLTASTAYISLAAGIVRAVSASEQRK